jgi:hypothetical protein
MTVVSTTSIHRLDGVLVSAFGGTSERDARHVRAQREGMQQGGVGKTVPTGEVWALLDSFRASGNPFQGLEDAVLAGNARRSDVT